MKTVHTRGSRLARALRTLAVAAATLAAGCGGHQSAAPGTPVVTLGDTSGDFAAYFVTLDSITLTASDNTVVSVLATPESVDLARLTDLSELLAAPAVPSGTYTSASISVDYSAVAIYLNLNGHAVLASAQSASGAAFGVTTTTITFDPGHPFVITAGASARLALDFDLAASNSINTTPSTPVVTVQPFLTLRPAPADSTLMRVRGLFVTVPTGSSTYIANTHPLRDLVSALGAVTVTTGAQTYFNVNGVAYTGAAGLAALAQLTTNTPVAAFGTLGDLSGITPGFNATAVYGGTSLESPLQEHLTGVVSARSGNTLTVRGAFFSTPAGYVNFTDSATVTLGSGTIVSENGVAASGLTPASVSVGQQIDASGQGSVATSGAVSLDATAGQVRMAPTRMWGTLNSASPGSLSLDAATFGNYAAAGLTFTGTGTSSVQDANPAAYAVNPGTIDETMTPANTLLRVDGFVNAFGSAPPDFTAAAISPGTATVQQLVVEWVNGGSATPFTPSSSGLIVNLGDANLGTIHHIRTGPAALDLKTLPPNLLITTAGADQNNLRLAIGSTTATGGISVFNSAASFATAVSSRFSGTTKLYRLVATGQYNSASNTFVASGISLALHE